MKLYVAAALVAFARQASSYRVVFGADDTYCIEVIPYSSSSEHGVDGSGAIGSQSDGSTTNGVAASTVAQNGVNDPTGRILLVAQDDWARYIALGSGVTIYLPGTTTEYTPTSAVTQSSIDWCPFYSTLAPDHLCKADGANESWQSNTLSDSIDDCCSRNHGGMYNECFEATAGIVPTGSGDWYPSYEEGKCVRDCDTANLFDPDSNNDSTPHAFALPNPDTSYECGGFPSYNVQEDDTPEECCSSAFTSILPAYCEWLSTTGSSSNPPAYPGQAVTTNSAVADAEDKFWYADTANGICVQDCIVGSSASEQCGGVITSASIITYDSSSACCSASISWDVNGCTQRSDAGEGNPTDTYWASPEGCRQDCVNQPNCATAPSTTKLYATAEECCQNANSWVNTDYCVTRANPLFSSTDPVNGGTNQWYVDYEDGACRKDCVGGPECVQADSGSLAFFASAESCCTSTLGYIDEAACISASESGESISTAETRKWYVNNGADQLCALDCAPGTGSDAPCGGIVSKSGVRLYDSAESCCENAYSWVNEALCVALSNNVDAATDLWYVDYSANICKQDCTVDGGDCVQPSGRPDDTSIALYETAEACCKARLSWTDSDTCTSASISGVDPTAADSPGTGKWRKNDSWSYCVLDCTAGAAVGAGDGILTVQPLQGSLLISRRPDPTFGGIYTGGNSGLDIEVGDPYPDFCDGVSSDSSAVHYDTIEDCCKSISWVQEMTCESLTTGEKSAMYFLDPSDGTKCVYHAGPNELTFNCVGGVIDSSGFDQVAGVTCEADISVSTKLYSTLDECCEAHVSWDKDNCVTRSKGDEAEGTRKFYVDWSLSKCVQDCPESSTTGDESCGGIANRWVTMYDSDTACCNRLNWIKRRDCIYTA